MRKTNFFVGLSSQYFKNENNIRDKQVSLRLSQNMV